MGAVVLSDNLGQLAQPANLGLGQPMSSTTWVASSFGTDARSFALATVTLAMDDCGPAQARLFSDAGGRPGTALADLGSQSCGGPGTWQATYSGGGYLLGANATYWIVLSAASASVTAGGWVWTSSSDGSGVGFQHTWGQTMNSGGTWQVAASSPMVMRVEADAVPEPGAWVMVGLGLLGLIAWKMRLPAVAK